MAFDPDEFLSEKTDFDPDAFLAESETEEDKILALGQGPIRTPEKEEPAFDPDEFLAEEVEAPNRTGKFEAGVLGSQEGLTLGFADEIMGALRTGTAKLGISDSKTKSIFDESMDLSDEYQAQRDDYRRYQKTAQQENPYSYGTGQFLGGAAAAAATGGMGPTSLMGKAALEGGAYGLGASEADLVEGEFGEAALDTAIGAGTGLAIPVAMKGAGKVLKGAAPLVEKTKPLGDFVTRNIKKVSDPLSEELFQSGPLKDITQKAASRVLGVDKKRLTPEVIRELKELGLGKLSKKKIISSIEEAIEEAAIPPIPGGRKLRIDPKETIKKLENLKSIMDDSSQGIISETVRAGKDAGVGDVMAMVAGPGTYGTKKLGEVALQRKLLRTPELARKAKFAIDDLANLPSNLPSKIGNKMKGVGSALEDNLLAPKITLSQIMIDQVQGTKYQNVFDDNNHKNAVKHNLLMNRDPEYRDLQLNKDNEE